MKSGNLKVYLVTCGTKISRMLTFTPVLKKKIDADRPLFRLGAYRALCSLHAYPIVARGLYCQVVPNLTP